MLLGPNLVQTLALFVAALLLAALLLRLLLRLLHRLAVGRARRIADRLRVPATTLAAVEDQSAAVEELCQFRDAQAGVAAARGLLAEDDATVRSAAIEILRRTRALDMWVRDLRLPSYRAKLHAIQALGEVGDERAVEELILALGDDDPGVARAASHAVVMRDPDYARDRLAEALSSPARRIAETAAATLVRLGNEAVESLVGQLASLSSQARRLAVESLAAIGSAMPAATLATMLDSDPAPEVRVAVAEALGRQSGEPAYSYLRRTASSDPDWFVRARAYALLAEVGAPGSAEFLLQSLAKLSARPARQYGEESVEAVLEGVERVRSAIRSGLRLLGVSDEEIAAAERPPEEEPTATLSDPPESALAATGASFESGPERHADDWSAAVSALSDHDPAQRLEAVRQLAEAGPVITPWLDRALQDPEPLVRCEAARALARMGTGESLPVLARCLHDPDTDVRLAASNALRAIIMREAVRGLPAPRDPVGPSRGPERAGEADADSAEEAFS